MYQLHGPSLALNCTETSMSFKGRTNLEYRCWEVIDIGLGPISAKLDLQNNVEQNAVYNRNDQKDESI